MTINFTSFKPLKMKLVLNDLEGYFNIRLKKIKFCKYNYIFWNKKVFLKLRNIT